MGLDGVELVLEVEEAFDIKIPDEAAEYSVTVGDLYGVVVALTEKSCQQRCIAGDLFRWIRRNMKRLGITARFRPSTKLEDVVPLEGRKEFWHAISQETGLKLPELVRPRWISCSALFCTIFLSFATALSIGIYSIVGAIFAFFAALILLNYAITKLTSPYEVEFQASSSSFRGLTENVIWRNSKKIGEIYGPIGPAEIWTILQSIVADVLQVDKQKVTKEARFIEDLGLC